MTASGCSLFIALIAHPDTPGPGVRRVAASARVAGPQSLRLQYVLEADPLLVRIPPEAADAGRTDKLWSHTCFEAFIRREGAPGYLELNFSPSGRWAAYRFDSYRQGMAPALEAPPRLTLRRLEQRLELQAEVHLGAGWPAGREHPEASRQRLRLALSTVVEDREGSLSYWALRHPPGRPDFHHPDSFLLELEPLPIPLSPP